MATDSGLTIATDACTLPEAATQTPKSAASCRKNGLEPSDVVVNFKGDCNEVTPAEIRLVRAHLDELLLQILGDVSNDQEDEQ